VRWSLDYCSDVGGQSQITARWTATSGTIDAEISPAEFDSLATITLTNVPFVPEGGATWFILSALPLLEVRFLC
jgi:hypothetical protein